MSDPQNDPDSPTFAEERGQRFAVVPEWLIDATADGSLSPKAFHLYALIACVWADWTTGDGWPRRQTIAARLGVSVDTIDRRLRELVDVGALRVEARFRLDGSQASNRYIIVRNCPQGAAPSAAPPSSEVRPLELDPLELDKSSATNASAAELPPSPPEPPATDQATAIAQAVAIVAERRGIDAASLRKPNPEAWASAARRGIAEELRRASTTAGRSALPQPLALANLISAEPSASPPPGAAQAALPEPRRPMPAPYAADGAATTLPPEVIAQGLAQVETLRKARQAQQDAQEEDPGYDCRSAASEPGIANINGQAGESPPPGPLPSPT